MNVRKCKHILHQCFVIIKAVVSSDVSRVIIRMLSAVQFYIKSSMIERSGYSVGDGNHFILMKTIQWHMKFNKLPYHGKRLPAELVTSGLPLYHVKLASKSSTLPGGVEIIVVAVVHSTLIPTLRSDWQLWISQQLFIVNYT